MGDWDYPPDPHVNVEPVADLALEDSIYIENGQLILRKDLIYGLIFGDRSL
jgi:hypothetical protein